MADDGAGLRLHIPSVMPSKVADLEASTTSPASLAPLESDYARQQHHKQLKNNYHSSSLAKMLPQNVNRTSLHPGGVEYDSRSNALKVLFNARLTYMSTGPSESTQRLKKSSMR